MPPRHELILDLNDGHVHLGDEPAVLWFLAPGFTQGLQDAKRGLEVRREATKFEHNRQLAVDVGLSRIVVDLDIFILHSLLGPF